jgi:hypothetical protein
MGVDVMKGDKALFLLIIPTNAFLSVAVFTGMLTSEMLMIFMGISVIFIEMMKTLTMATAVRNATIEFGLSLLLLMGLVIYVQSMGLWGFNLSTACVYIQFLDTICGFVGTFLLARRDFGH